jgi:hypothetical protein
MNRSQRTMALISCCAAAAVLLTGERRGWWAFHPPFDWVLPVGLMAAGIILWATGSKSGGRT